jgi:hypothetical protein
MLTGSAFRANIAAPAEHFRTLKGKPRQYIKTADSGIQRDFAKLVVRRSIPAPSTIIAAIRCAWAR